mmetsp:Transcript_21367/g.84984  ORF Transcript_21367/g.84984 Transcript_21367/m.84984 type:complete len:256 (+) Transcript_21367:131-898(+)
MRSAVRRAMMPSKLTTQRTGLAAPASLVSALTSCAVAWRVRSATCSMLKSIRSRTVPWSMTRTASSRKMCATSLTERATASMPLSRSSRNRSSASKARASSSVTSFSPGRRASRRSRARFSAPFVRNVRSTDELVWPFLSEEDEGRRRLLSAGSSSATASGGASSRRYRRASACNRTASFVLALTLARAVASVSSVVASNGPPGCWSRRSARRRCSRAVCAASPSSRSSAISSLDANVTRSRRLRNDPMRRSSHL